MKECKLIHINDGCERELRDGNRFYAEEFPETRELIGTYLEEGWQVVHMVPDFSPAIQGEGRYSFYKTSWTFYLEREA